MNHSEFQRVLELAFADAMEKQPTIAARKNTIAAITGGLLQIGQISAVSIAGLPWWASVIIGLVLFVSEAIFHATTNATVSPSVYRKVNQAAADRIAAEPTELEPYTADPVVVPVIPQIVESTEPAEPSELDALRNKLAANG